VQSWLCDPAAALGQCDGATCWLQRGRLLPRLLFRGAGPAEASTDGDADAVDVLLAPGPGVKDSWKVNGVVIDKIEADEDSFTINGKPISKGGALYAIQAAAVPEDNLWPHLTIICRDHKVGQGIVTDLVKEPDMAAWLKSLRVQLYDPTNKVHQEMLAGWKLDQDPEFQRSGVMIAYQPPADKDGMAPVKALFERVAAKQIKVWLDRVAGSPRPVPHLKVDVAHSLAIPPALYVLGGAGLVGAAGFLRIKSLVDFGRFLYSSFARISRTLLITLSLYKSRSKLALFSCSLRCNSISSGSSPLKSGLSFEVFFLNRNLGWALSWNTSVFPITFL